MKNENVPPEHKPEQAAIPDFSHIANFLQQLPDVIQGSAHQYSKAEIQRTISDILFGDRSLAILTNTFGIHDFVHSYMRTRVQAAWAAFPEYSQADFNPQTGKKFTTFEETFRFADYLLRTSDLKPSNQKLSLHGLAHASQQDCANLFDDMFTHANSYSRTSEGQTHLYYENSSTRSNLQANIALSPNPQLDHITALATNFVAAQLSRDGQHVTQIVAETDAFLENGGIAALAREFKFHVTPPPNLLPLYVDRLLQVIQHDPYVRDNVIGFKVNTIPNEQSDGQLIPDIAIYPRRGQTAQTARANAAIFLERLKVHLADLDTHAPCIGTPRYNTQITNTIAIAQSGGDVKNHLQRMRLLDKYFSAESNYAFVVPEYVNVT